MERAGKGAPDNRTPDILPRISIGADGRPVAAWQGFAGRRYREYSSKETMPVAREAFIRAVYMNLLNRDVPDDDAGVEYWAKELRIGNTTPGAVIGNIIHAAIQLDGMDWATIWNKVQVAEYFTEQFRKRGGHWRDGDLELARQALRGVTDDPDSVDEGKTEVDRLLP
ncbi:DUF4214 domain-containing protein [Desulfonatronum parangueonense]